ncbi:hypothetical protein FNV43_RR23956 [Rhamnella rubrinervis]|uniref:Pyruvate kinase n=1 Tax=Rhamnella rubrinervis TaxID=2594499 RepID=A0A8K0DRB9_9ROSA|nr:hypothetical protein FNV43_RR23956 [Rhamnella rubrinervis]
MLLEAMKSPNPSGVMIARVDLAVECGWERLADIKEEILSICSAAHIPVIWATQILESYAKSGVPTRAEITDVASGRSCKEKHDSMEWKGGLIGTDPISHQHHHPNFNVSSNTVSQ